MKFKKHAHVKRSEQNIKVFAGMTQVALKPAPALGQAQGRDGSQGFTRAHRGLGLKGHKMTYLVIFFC